MRSIATKLVSSATASARRLWLLPLILVLGGCVTHYYPAPQSEAIYSVPADSSGNVYHVEPQYGVATTGVSYVVTARYYPWWSLDYFYLNYGYGSCCGLSVGISWGYPRPRPWYGWYGWYGPWYWPPYHYAWYPPYPHYYRHHYHHPVHHGYAHDYWHHKWRQRHPRQREIIDGRYGLPEQPVAHHPGDRRDRIGTRPPRDYEDRKPGPYAAAGSPAVVSRVTPALSESAGGTASTVRSRAGAKMSPYRELHPWERSAGEDRTSVRRVIPADGSAAAPPKVRVISASPVAGSSNVVRSAAGSKSRSVRSQPVMTPRSPGDGRRSTVSPRVASREAIQVRPPPTGAAPVRSTRIVRPAPSSKSSKSPVYASPPVQRPSVPMSVTTPRPQASPPRATRAAPSGSYRVAPPSARSTAPRSSSPPPRASARARPPARKKADSRR